MNKMALIVVALAVMAPAWAAGQVSAERGKELFESTGLGSNHKSCASCHPKGNKLESAASYQQPRLEKIVNMCIQQMLAGTPLPPDSDDMASLISYLRSFAHR